MDSYTLLLIGVLIVGVVIAGMPAWMEIPGAIRDLRAARRSGEGDG